MSEDWSANRGVFEELTLISKGIYVPITQTNYILHTVWDHITSSLSDLE